MNRNCLSAELMDFEGVISTPNKPLSQQIKIQYEEIIAKQSQMIKKLYRQCLTLRKVVQHLKSEQIFNAEKNSNPESVDMKKLEDIVAKQLFKELAQIFEIQVQDISKAKVLQIVKRLQWQKNKKAEPIFIERLKEVRVPVPVEVFIEKQVIKYVDKKQEQNTKDSKVQTQPQQQRIEASSKNDRKQTTKKQHHQRKCSEDIRGHHAYESQTERRDLKQEKYETQSMRNQGDKGKKQNDMNKTMYQKGSKYGTKSQKSFRKNTPLSGEDLLDEELGGRVVRKEYKDQHRDWNERQGTGNMRKNVRPRQQNNQSNGYEFDARRFQNKKHDSNINKTRQTRNGYVYQNNRRDGERNQYRNDDHEEEEDGYRYGNQSRNYNSYGNGRNPRGHYDYSNIRR